MNTEQLYVSLFSAETETLSLSLLFMCFVAASTAFSTYTENPKLNA